MTPEDEALLARVGDDGKDANGIPREEFVEGRRRALQLVSEALDDVLQANGIRTSPLGPEWSSDIDAHVSRRPPVELLASRGWIPLERLLERLGSEGAGRWAVVDGGRALAALDLHLVPPYRPVEGIVARCRRRGEVRVREVLELRALQRDGHELPSCEVVALAARVEAALGGDELARWRDDEPVGAPAPLPSERLRRKVGRLVPRRGRRVGVAVSGVDGAGKSTLVGSLRHDLAAAGVTAATVWTRPGLGLRWLEVVARGGKRLLRQKPAPGVRAAAEGRGAELPSRRGLVGWVWSLLVTLSFLRRVRRDVRRVRGVVVFDRHLADALATLEFANEGVDLRVHRALVKRLLPHADLTLYLDVEADAAVARKPGDVIGERAVRRQLEVYAEVLRDVPRVTRLDATRPPDELAAEAFRAVAEL